jgi:6-phosphofructokinase 2
MKPVVTLTMNPALDLNTSVEQVVSGHKMRCGPGRLDPGGGGVNVARVVRRLGGEALVVYTVGGPTGELYEKLLEAEGAACRPVPIAGNTRQDFTADETGTGKQYRFVLQGPELSEPEWRSCLDALAKQIVPDAYVVASGSLEPRCLDRRDVDESIRSTALRLNETKALGGVEPLHGSGWQRK